MDEFLKESPFKPISKFYKGDVPKHERERRRDSGFSSVLGEDEAVELHQQIKNAIEFLLKYEKELDRLRQMGANSLVFDFGFVPPDQLQTSVYFPPEFMVMLSRFGIGLMVSVVKLGKG